MTPNYLPRPGHQETFFLKPIAILQSGLNWESKFNYFSADMEFRLLTYLAIGKQNINSGSCLSSNLHVLPATHHSLLQPAPDKTAIIDIVGFTQVIYSQVYGKLFSTIIILEWVFWWTIELQVISSISRYLTYFTKRLWGLYSKHRT